MADKILKRRPRVVQDEDLEVVEEAVEEVVEVQQPPVRRRRLVATGDNTAVVEEPKAVAKEEPVREDKTIVGARRKPKSDPAVAVVADDDEADTLPRNQRLPKTLAESLDNQNILDILERLREGETLSFTRKKDQLILTMAEPLTIDDGIKIRGKKYYDEVLSDEFKEWQEWWSKLSPGQRLEEAEKIATWEKDKDPKVNIMKASAAYREAKGIEKYKEQYRSRSARAAIKA